MESKDNKNAILAVVLSGIILFGWNYFFGAQPYVTPDGVQSKVGENLGKKEIQEGAASKELTKTTREEAPNQIMRFELEKSWVEIDNSFNLLNFHFENAEIESRDNFKSHESKVSIFLNGKTYLPKFNFVRVEKNSYKISDTLSGLTGSVKFLGPGYLEIRLINPEVFNTQITLSSKQVINEDDERKSNSFVFLGDGLEQVIVGNDDQDYGEYKFKWLGLDYNYHLLSYVVDSKKLSRIDYGPKEITLRTIQPSNDFSFKIYYAKKNYDDLVALGNDLSKSVDFGMWAIIAVPILRSLQFIFDQTQNYGLAIIILTILMRLLLFPLQYKSFKSMKKMQVIQPELQKIRERHKENPQKLQQETMALFKKAGANPMSGCLPMLAQMPVFFAFYQVLFTSVELVGAPFYFWISDLSEKDPLYILPVLMGLAMFLNMKLTPATTADPTQQKMMMFMPVIFSLFMLNLPSGLTLYILISTVVGMGQQLLVYRQVA